MLQHAWLSQHVRTWKTCHAWRSGSMCKAELHPNLSLKFTNLPHGFIYLVGLLGTVLGKGIPTTLSSWLPQKIDEKGSGAEVGKKSPFSTAQKRWQFRGGTHFLGAPGCTSQQFVLFTKGHLVIVRVQPGDEFAKKQLINTWQQISWSWRSINFKIPSKLRSTCSYWVL